MYSLLMEDSEIKGLSIRQPWASLIASGKKTLEVRTWPCKYRGRILICASRSREKLSDDLPRGVTICLATIIACRAMEPGDVQAAGGVTYDAGMYVWELADIKPVNAVAIRGTLSFFKIPADVQSRL